MVASIGIGAPGGTRLQRARDLALIALALVTCVVGFQAYQGFIFEDAYITFRYADNLASGRGFTFNPGERVLGTTTPLYAMVLAVLGLVGIDIPSAGTALSVASLAGVALAGAWILRRRAHPDLGVLFAVLVLWGGFFTYYLSGMETAFYSLLLFGSALAAWHRRFVWTGILIGLAFLTRYDAVTFAAPLLFLAWLSDARAGWRAALRGPLKAALVAAALAVPWLVFASVYFGSPLPNTLAAKKDLTAPLVYLWDSAQMFPRHLLPLVPARIDLEIGWLDGASTLALLAPIPFALLALARSWNVGLVFLLHPLSLWLAYAGIGAGLCLWHVVPAFFSLALLGLLAWGCVLDRFGTRTWPTWCALVLLGASFVFLPGNLRRQSQVVRSTDSYQKRERGYEETAAWMRARGLLDLVVCTAEPGYFTHLTNCRVVDQAGLITRGVRPGEDLLGLVTRFGAQALLAPDLIDGFRRVCEVPQRLSVREDVVRERLTAFARPWLERAAPGATSAAETPALDWDFEPGAHHGWRGMPAFVGRPEPFELGGEALSDAYLSTSPELTHDTTCKLVSPPFPIEFDELAFHLGMGGATAKRGLRVELLVNDLPVLEASPAELGKMSEVRWPVHAWRGMKARLYVVDSSTRAWLALDHVRSIRKQHARVLDDFEAPTFGPGWTVTFAGAPVPYARTAEALGLEFILGQATASSLDVPGTARLVSAPFAVDHDELAFVVQSFGGSKARVELSVDGETVRTFAPSGENGLHAVAFDLAPFRGREAVLSAYDDDPDPARGIGLDALALFDFERSE